MLKALALLTLAATCHAQPTPDAHEVAWSGWIAEQLDGEAEAGFTDTAGRGRVDVLTDQWAIEVEWPKTPKAPESLDQASRYGEAFDRTPVVIYLVGRGNRTAEKAIAATTLQFGKRRTPRVVVVWMDINKPDVPRVKRLIEKAAEKPDKRGIPTETDIQHGVYGAS